MNKKMMNRRAMNEREAEAKHYAEELARFNAAAQAVHRAGVQVGTAPGGPDHEDVVAHLKQMPPHRAVEQAREWTGRDDITTLDEAIAAVEEALKG
jgi:hypothetical protein